LLALPLELKKSSLPLKAKKHHALRSVGGRVLSIRKGLTKKGSTFDNINTIYFALFYVGHVTD
jgi:hypothetical protein